MNIIMIILMSMPMKSRIQNQYDGTFAGVSVRGRQSPVSHLNSGLSVDDGDDDDDDVDHGSQSQSEEETGGGHGMTNANANVRGRNRTPTHIHHPTGQPSV